MKTSIFLAAFSLLILRVQAQSYTPLPNTTAIWTGNHCSYFSSSGMIYKTGMFGDTVINTQSYKKIYGSTDFHFNLGTASYLCALRETGKKVYFVESGNANELLLYDFNLNVGDTAKVHNIMGLYTKLKVDSIDQVLVNGQSCKRWIFNANGSFHARETWIEGLGSSFGLLWPLLSISDNIYSLLCLSSEGTIIYHDASVASNFMCLQIPNYDCDADMSTGLHDKEFPLIGSSVFPNPFSERSTLKTDQELKNTELSIYDVLGQEVMKQLYLNGKEVLLFKENLTGGCYYYKLSQSNRMVSKGKFIIE